MSGKFQEEEPDLAFPGLETTNAKPTPGAPGLPRDVGDPPGGSLQPAVLNAAPSMAPSRENTDSAGGDLDQENDR